LHFPKLLSEDERSLDERLYAFCSKQIAFGKTKGEFNSDSGTEFSVGLIITVLTGTGRERTARDHGFNLQDTFNAEVFARKDEELNREDDDESLA